MVVYGIALSYWGGSSYDFDSAYLYASEEERDKVYSELEDNANIMYSTFNSVLNE